MCRSRCVAAALGQCGCLAEVEQEMAAALEKKMLEVRKWEETTRKEMQQQIASQQQEQLKILEVCG